MPPTIAPEKPAAVEITDEVVREVAAFTEDILSEPRDQKTELPATLGGRLTVDDDPEKPAAEPEAPPKDPKTGQFVKAPKVKPAAKPAKPAPKQLTADEIAEAAARGAAEGTRRATAPKPELKPAPSPEGPDTSHLDDEDKRDLPVLKRLEKLYPAKYKGLHDTFVKEAKEAAEYQAKWEKEHPGETYDPESADHEAFFKDKKADWTDRDFNEALADMKAEERLAAFKGESNQEVEALKLRERARDLLPEIVSEQARIGKMVLTEFGEEFLAMQGENGLVKHEAMTKMIELDPIAGPLVYQAATQAQLLASETIRLFNGMGSYPGADGRAYIAHYDGNKPTPMQKDIADFALRQEEELLTKPVEEQQDGQGRAFVADSKWSTMTAIERAKHWMFDARTLNALRAAEMVRNTRAVIEAQERHLEAVALKRGYARNGNHQQTADQITKPATPAAAPQNHKPVSPTAGAGTRTPQRKLPGDRTPADSASDFARGVLEG